MILQPGGDRECGQPATGGDGGGGVPPGASLHRSSCRRRCSCSSRCTTHARSHTLIRTLSYLLTHKPAHSHGTQAKSLLVPAFVSSLHFTPARNFSCGSACCTSVEVSFVAMFSSMFRGFHSRLAYSSRQTRLSKLQTILLTASCELKHIEKSVKTRHCSWSCR